MTKDDIIQLPDKRLRQKSQKIGYISDHTKALAENMKQATLDWEASRQHETGVALAAVQIGELWRVIIVRNDFENKEDKDFKVLINPKIVKVEGEPEKDFEGCLSIKDIYGKVPRFPIVKIRAHTLENKEVTIKAEGFLARVLQHEIDHMHGSLFIDYIDNNEFYKIKPDGELVPIPPDRVVGL